MPHIDPDQLRQCIVQSSLGSKLNDTKACMRAAFPNFQPPDLKAEMEQAGAKLSILFVYWLNDIYLSVA